MKIQQISPANLEQLPRPLRERVGVRGLFENPNHNELSPKINERITNLNHSPIAIANAAKISFGSDDSKTPNDLFAEEISKENPDAEKLLQYVNDDDFKPNRMLKGNAVIKLDNFANSSREYDMTMPPVYALLLKIEKCYEDKTGYTHLLPVFRDVMKHPDTMPFLPVDGTIISDNSSYTLRDDFRKALDIKYRLVRDNECACQLLDVFLENSQNFTMEDINKMWKMSHNRASSHKLLDYMERNGISANELFTYEFNETAPDIERLVGYVQKEGFDPNYVVVDNKYPYELPLLHEICHLGYRQNDTDMSDVVAALVNHPGIDINKTGKLYKKKTHIADFGFARSEDRYSGYCDKYLMIALDNRHDIDINEVQSLIHSLKGWERYGWERYAELFEKVKKYYEEHQANVNAFFWDEFEDTFKLPNQDKLAKIVKLRTFKPNETFDSPLRDYSKMTPMLMLLVHDNEKLFLADEIADLAKHPDFDPNISLGVNQQTQKTYLLEYLVNGDLKSAAVNLRKILENNPNVRVIDAPTKEGQRTNMLELAEQKGKNDLAELLRNYEERGGRQKAAEKYKKTGGVYQSHMFKLNNYSELSIEELLDFLKLPTFDVTIAKDAQGNLLIHTAVTMKNPRSKELISLSNEKIKNIDVKNAKGQTPAMLALESIGTCENKDERRICYGIFKFILYLNPVLTLNDNNGLNLDDYAGELNDPLVKQMLEQYKASKKD